MKKTQTEKRERHIGRAIACSLILFLAALIFFSARWVLNTFGFISMDELLFHLKVPLSGTGSDMVSGYIKGALLPSLPFLLFGLIFIINPFRTSWRLAIKGAKHQLKIGATFICVMFCIMLLGISTVKSAKSLGVDDYIAEQLTESSFIEENYVDPRNVTITFPEQKRNIIYIYLESMETTYMPSALGGHRGDLDLMPELEQLLQENTNFSNTDLLGGARQVSGTSWTMGAMFAQTTGLPLKIPIEENSMDSYSSFLPGAYALGDLLEDNGYNQMLMVGSDAAFGGRELYFTEHGNYQIYDYNTAIEEGKIPSDYFVWWGFEDAKLYEYAKEQITDLASEDAPFNFTMLTVDTHHVGGYHCELCRNDFDDTPYDFNNVLACAGRQVAEFVQWCQQQDFYEDTAIVIAGDHLSMYLAPAIYYNDDEDNYTRTTINCFVNSAAETENVKNRQFCTMDMFPTTLAAMGITVEGDRLGLGTNLFSDTPTLIEQYGFDYVNEQVALKSSFYNKFILYSN